MSEVAEIQKGNLLVKATNLSSVMLAMLFYILSLAFVANTIIVHQRLKSIDASFQQMAQVISNHAQAIQRMQEAGR